MRTRARARGPALPGARRSTARPSPAAYPLVTGARSAHLRPGSSLARPGHQVRRTPGRRRPGTGPRRIGRAERAVPIALHRRGDVTVDREPAAGVAGLGQATAEAGGDVDLEPVPG